MLVSPQNPTADTKVALSRRITTLYALIEALQEQGEPGDDAHIGATLLHLCQTGRLRFLDVGFVDGIYGLAQLIR